MTDQLSPERVEDERRLFEAAMREQGWTTNMLIRLGNGEYLRNVQNRFIGWLMARASIQPVVTEGMVEAGARALVKHDEYEWDKQQYEAKENAKDQARACLTAALSPHGERVDG